MSDDNFVVALRLYVKELSNANLGNTLLRKTLFPHTSSLTKWSVRPNSKINHSSNSYLEKSHGAYKYVRIQVKYILSTVPNLNDLPQTPPSTQLKVHMSIEYHMSL